MPIRARQPEDLDAAWPSVWPPKKATPRPALLKIHFSERTLVPAQATAHHRLAVVPARSLAKDAARIVRRPVGECFRSDGGGGTPAFPSVVAEQLDRGDE
jgi:hypothetical protein